MAEIILNELSTREFQNLQKLYWTNKLGNYPVRIEKVGQKITWEEFNKQQEQEDLEFREFLKDNNK